MAMGKGYRVFHKIPPDRETPYSVLMDSKATDDSLMFESGAVVVLSMQFTRDSLIICNIFQCQKNLNDLSKCCHYGPSDTKYRHCAQYGLIIRLDRPKGWKKKKASRKTNNRTLQIQLIAALARCIINKKTKPNKQTMRYQLCLVCVITKSYSNSRHHSQRDSGHEPGYKD